MLQARDRDIDTAPRSKVLQDFSRCRQLLKSSDPFLVRHKRLIGIRSPVTEKLPCVAHFANQIQIQIGDNQCVLITWRLSNDLPARITEVALPVKLANVPGVFVANAIYGS